MKSSLLSFSKHSAALGYFSLKLAWLIPRLKAMRKKVTSDEGRRIYGRRAATV